MRLSFVIVLLPFFLLLSNSAATINSIYKASMSVGLFSAPGEDVNMFKLSTDGLTKEKKSIQRPDIRLRDSELALIKKIIDKLIKKNYNLKPY